MKVAKVAHLYTHALSPLLDMRLKNTPVLSVQPDAYPLLLLLLRRK
jgi:hypothetical protein